MINRARPLLGTIVSIRSEATEAAVSAAFAAIETVHRLMSPLSETGDLARINREAHRRSVRVHLWTLEVLRCAGALSEESAGAFDVTLRRLGASHRDIVLLPDGRVRLRRRARLDLGGIAKGFAVDRAVDVLRRFGAQAGSVNAGGDLRVFGDVPQTIRVRLPGAPLLAARLFEAREQSLATSGRYFGSLQKDARSGRELCSGYSITVCAPTCMLADGLTKAVAALGPQPALLARFGAQAYLLGGNGGLHAARG
jgi:thiamine biosynthesis lipoprotein